MIKSINISDFKNKLLGLNEISVNNPMKKVQVLKNIIEKNDWVLFYDEYEDVENYDYSDDKLEEFKFYFEYIKPEILIKDIQTQEINSINDLNKKYSFMICVPYDKDVCMLVFHNIPGIKFD